MGTNYQVTADPTCDNPAHIETLHIGKSSGGWKFSFHGIPERDLTSWAAWKAFIADKPVIDEYGQTLTLEEFTKVVEERWSPSGRNTPHCHVTPDADTKEHGFGGRWYDGGGEYHDPEGYDFFNGEFC